MYVKEGLDLRVLYDESIVEEREKFPHLTMPSFEAFEAFYQGARTLAFMHEHTCIGGMVIHEQHGHLLVCRAFHGKWARLWPVAFQWALGVCEPLYGLIPVDNKKIIKFVISIGAQLVQEEVAYFGLTAHRYRFETAHMKYPQPFRKRHAARATAETPPEHTLASATPWVEKESCGVVSM